jgi:hypothetical protein
LFSDVCFFLEGEPPVKYVSEVEINEVLAIVFEVQKNKQDKLSVRIIFTNKFKFFDMLQSKIQMFVTLISVTLFPKIKKKLLQQ